MGKFEVSVGMWAATLKPRLSTIVVAVAAVSRCEPVPRVEHAVADSQLAVKDSVVHYTCVEGFMSADLSAMSTVCDGNNWSPSLTHCESNYLWSPYVIGQTIIFLPCYFYLLSFFIPRLFSAAADWMSTILAHMV